MSQKTTNHPDTDIAMVDHVENREKVFNGNNRRNVKKYKTGPDSKISAVQGYYGDPKNIIGLKVIDLMDAFKKSIPSIEELNAKDGFAQSKDDVSSREDATKDLAAAAAKNNPN